MYSIITTNFFVITIYFFILLSFGIILVSVQGFVFRPDYCCSSSSLQVSSSSSLKRSSIGIGSCYLRRHQNYDQHLVLPSYKPSIKMTSTTTNTATSSSSLSSSPPDDNNDEINNNKKLFLFDFDGVVCNSCDECTVSAIRTCHKLGVFSKSEYTLLGLGVEDDTSIVLTDDYIPPDWLLEKMRQIRPAIEIGWQIPVLLDVILLQQQQEEEITDRGGTSSGEKKTKTKKILSVDDIITNYSDLVDKTLKRWNKTEKDMVDAFGTVRDEWISNNFNSWLDINTFYDGIPEAITSCSSKDNDDKNNNNNNKTPYVITTKQQRFAISLCRHSGINEESLPDESIYGLGMYKGKTDVINEKMINGQYKPNNVFFFEDRYPTLIKCLNDKRLKDIPKFYLCSWGYVTEKEINLANNEPRVDVINLNDFVKIVIG